jgi:hypothetical protein
MSELFRNTLPLWQWGILALVPLAIVALYFLKLKRVPLEVPSTFLWKRTVEDLHVNSLWQRLRKSLLLFLQLLLVILAMLALLRPGWLGTRLEGQRFIFLVDNSASMSATDAIDAPSRLEEAKQAAAGLIDQMDSSMSAMIISFSDTPQVVQGFTSSRRQLDEALASIEPTSRSTDLHGALDLARGLAGAGLAESTLYIFSDGRFDDIKDFSLGSLRPVYVPVGSFDADNLAITAFSTGRNELRPDSQQAFVQVANFTDDPQTAIVELQLDGRFLDAQDVKLAAGDVTAVVFSLSNAAPGGLTARLKRTAASLAVRDALPQDDVAYAALNDVATGRVLVVSPGNSALEAALNTDAAHHLADVRFVLPSFLKTDEYQLAAEAGLYDLVIFDQCAPNVMPRANTVFVGQVPPGPAWRGERATTADSAASRLQPPEEEASIRSVTLPQIIDWDRGHPLLAHVELGSIDIAESLVLDVPRGGDVLIDSTDGPIAAIAPRDSYEDVVLGFEIVGQTAEGASTANTNWPRRLSFPTFWLNGLEYLAGGSAAGRMAEVRPGQPVELPAPGNVQELTVVDPANRETTVRKTDQDVFPYHDTDRPGVYQVRQGGKSLERFAVNLFDRAESDIRLRPSQDAQEASVTPADIRIGHVDVAASVGQAPSRKELWKWLLAGALVVLLLEWYIFNRRVYL